MKTMIRIALAALALSFVGISANCSHDEPEPRVVTHHHYVKHKSHAPEAFDPVEKF